MNLRPSTFNLQLLRGRPQEPLRLCVSVANPALQIKKPPQNVRKNVRACLKNRPAMGLRARQAGWRGATREHIREKSVTEEQQRQPACPAARPPGIFFSHALKAMQGNASVFDPLPPGGARFNGPDTQKTLFSTILHLFQPLNSCRFYPQNTRILMQKIPQNINPPFTS